MSLVAHLDLDPAVARETLQHVARGQIVSENGMLRHRDRALTAEAVSVLQTLHRHRYLTLTPASVRPPVAALSMSGTQLLDWLNRQPSPPNPASASTTAEAGARSVDLVAEVSAHGSPL